MRRSKIFKKNLPHRSIESPICKCFWKWCFVHTCGQHFILYFFPLSEFNLHAASILQSIVVNRLQCVLLSVPLSLYMTGCGSAVTLNHIQVSVHVDACCYGVVPTVLNVKETNCTLNPNLHLYLMPYTVMQNLISIWISQVMMHYSEVFWGYMYESVVSWAIINTKKLIQLLISHWFSAWPPTSNLSECKNKTWLPLSFDNSVKKCD